MLYEEKQKLKEEILEHVDTLNKSGSPIAYEKERAAIAALKFFADSCGLMCLVKWDERREVMLTPESRVNQPKALALLFDGGVTYVG